MPETKRDREAALHLLGEYVQGETLLRHCLTVEAVMRHFAPLFGEDPGKWGLTGLLHDIDFERWPERHCAMARRILEPQGWPEEIIRAIESHGYGICSDVKPETDMEKTLYTVDELSGLIYAAALPRPSRSLDDMQVKSVRKKWKQKSFASGCNREVIEKGVEMMGWDLSRVIAETIAGMRPIEEELGLERLPA